MAPSPTVTPDTIVTFAPIQTFLPILIGSRMQDMRQRRVLIVVERRQHDIMPNERTVPDLYAALILKMAAGIR